MRSTAQVLAACRAEHESSSAQWEGMCLKFVRTMYGIAARYPSASSAWVNAQRKHPVSSGAQVPRGAPVFWTGGSGGFGHVAVSIGGGMCWTSDFKRRGDIDLASIDAITRAWGLNFKGWTNDINGVTAFVVPPKETPRMDRIVEVARGAQRVTSIPEKDADLGRIITLARKWSTKY